MTRPRIAIVVFDEVEVLDFAGPFEVFSAPVEDLRAKVIDAVKSRCFSVPGIGGQLELFEDGIGWADRPTLTIVPN